MTLSCKQTLQRTNNFLFLNESNYGYNVLFQVLIGRSQVISDKFEDKIDPFDLDVFCPYIQNNIKRSVQRSQVCKLCGKGKYGNEDESYL